MGQFCLDLINLQLTQNDLISLNKYTFFLKLILILNIIKLSKKI